MGAKTIETRSWQTGYRGPLLIHASLGKKAAVLCEQPPFSHYITNFQDLPFGALVGSVVLENIIPVEKLYLPSATLATLTLEEKAFGDYTKGRYAWLLSRPLVFQHPIAVKGTLGLWNYVPLC